jgi:hypothetical protein
MSCVVSVFLVLKFSLAVQCRSGAAVFFCIPSLPRCHLVLGAEIHGPKIRTNHHPKLSSFKYSEIDAALKPLD